MGIDVRVFIFIVAFAIFSSVSAYGQGLESDDSQAFDEKAQVLEHSAAGSDSGTEEQSGQPIESHKDAVDISKASDQQINEAQRFYKACSNNEQLSLQHDCKCLAGEYLVARMSRGDEASHKQVFSDVRALCLKNSEDKSALNSDQGEEREEFTEAEVKEANYVFEWCQADAYMPIYHDCKCLASEFVAKRKELGRLPSRDSILSTLKGVCLNGTQMAGFLYKDCISKPALLPLHLKNVKKFCECYANQFAKGFEGLEGTRVSSNSTGALARMTMSKCQNEQRTFTLN
ncbi:MAG: hypothetical protein KA099_01725 [Alphaproteobacteria bacterium]|nr:hypothetical protein [Alphaproteobacteria bacterium]MBP7761627.1 hypothetical protein [Alphaproteobacteria bacterium]MBP7904021.1 hypothetical protein [Alphaproteobacteria bacterium]